MNVARAELPIGQVAKRAGVGVQTVRYYERRGLLPPPTRRHSGRRIYEATAVDLLRAVKTAKRLGFTLAEIEELLRLSHHRSGDSSKVQERMRDKLVEIDGKIADLYTMRKRLAGVLHAGCDSLTECTCPACPLYAEVGDAQSGASSSVELDQAPGNR
jgi:DNA-binding transcriptional MerR regulator